jgi:hypothetical protein
MDPMNAVKEFLNYLFQNTGGPVDEHVAPRPHAESGRRDHFAATALLQDAALNNVG